MTWWSEIQAWLPRESRPVKRCPSVPASSTAAPSSGWSAEPSPAASAPAPRAIRSSGQKRRRWKA